MTSPRAKGNVHEGRAHLRQLERLLSARCRSNAPEYRSECARVSDWRALLGVADAHGLEAELMRRSAIAGVEIPAPVREESRRRRLRSSGRRLWVADAHDKVLGALALAGVRAATLKGTVLAERIYPDAWCRTSTDVDILVARDDVLRAVAALVTLGYTGGSDVARWPRPMHDHHVHAFHPAMPQVEIHFRAFSGFGTRLPSEELLERARPYRTSSGAATWVLAPADEIAYLATHASNHMLERAIWLYDLVLFVEKHPELDWTAAAAISKRYDLGAAVLYALDAARTRFGARIPLDAWRGVQRPSRFRAAGRLEDSVRDGGSGADLASKVRRVAFSALLADRPATVVRYVATQLRRGSRRDWTRDAPAHRAAQAPVPIDTRGGIELALGAGHRVAVTIAGPSMAPSLRVGWRVDVVAAPARIMAGDVVVLRGTAGLVTHRVMHVFAHGGRGYLVHWGDGGVAPAVAARAQVVGLAVRVESPVGAAFPTVQGMGPATRARFARRCREARAYALAWRAVRSLRDAGVPMPRALGSVVRRALFATTAR